MGDQRMGGQTYPHSFTHNNSITVDSSLSVGGMSSPFNSDASVASFTTSSNTLSYKTPESISIAPATATSNKESSASDSYKTPDEMAESISIAPATAPSNKESSASALSISQFKIKDLNLDTIKDKESWTAAKKIIDARLRRSLLPSLESIWDR